MLALKKTTFGFLCLIALTLFLLVLFYGKWIGIRTAQIRSPDGITNLQRRITEVSITSGLPKESQIPDDRILAKLNESGLNQVYWNYINKLQILCKDVIRVGSLRDGGKEICIDNGYRPKAPCLVYSFGISNQFDFDKAVVDYFGCDVHCFDPSMKKKTQRISEHIWFYQWGLGGENNVTSKGWEIKTLDTIRRELGHTHTAIDILKIDIEGYEWISIPQMISSGALDDVTQIAMETHFSRKTLISKAIWGGSTVVSEQRQLSALRQLYDFGYRTFMRERNLHGRPLIVWPGFRNEMTKVNEISMIKPIQNAV